MRTVMLTLALVAACGPKPSVRSSATSDAQLPALCVTVSVDWEGAYFEEPDLVAMETFAERAPGVPLTHLLNAAYYTKEGADAARITAQIRRALRPGDETGLHVHAWESLAEHAELTAREEPSFLSDDPLIIDGDAGFDIALESYSVDEIRGFVRASRSILAEHGFTLSTSFRAGGWLAGERVRHAIRAEGFEIDTSAVDAGWMDEAEHTPMQAAIRAIWPTITPDMQPFFLNTPAGRLLEMPDTGGLADYLTEEEMLDHVERALAKADAERAAGPQWARTRFVHLGFHFEGAADFSSRVSNVIEAVRARHPGDRVVFETLEACARRARDSLGSKRASR